MHRIICDLIIYRLEPGIAQSGIAAIACAENDARRRHALVDRRLRNVENPCNLFGRPVFEKQVEASAVLFGQTRPARSIVRKITAKVLADGLPGVQVIEPQVLTAIEI